MQNEQLSCRAREHGTGSDQFTPHRRQLHPSFLICSRSWITCLPSKLQVCQGQQDTMHCKPFAAPTSHNSPKAPRAQESGPKTSGSHQPEVFHSHLPLAPASDPAPSDMPQAVSRARAHVGKVLGGTDGHQECPSQDGCTLLGEPNSCCFVTGPSSLPQLHCADHLTPWWSYRQEQHPQGANGLLQRHRAPGAALSM